MFPQPQHRVSLPSLHNITDGPPSVRLTFASVEVLLKYLISASLTLALLSPIAGLSHPCPEAAVNPNIRSLSVEEIEHVAVSFKDDLTRECERRVRRNDNSGALAAIVGKEYIDKFVYTLRANAVSQIRAHLNRPPRARAIRIFGKGA